MQLIKLFLVAIPALATSQFERRGAPAQPLGALQGLLGGLLSLVQQATPYVTEIGKLAGSTEKVDAAALLGAVSKAANVAKGVSKEVSKEVAKEVAQEVAKPVTGDE